MSSREFNPKRFSKILVGVDDSPDAQLAFRFAMNRAKQDDSELDLVTVIEENDINIYQALDKNFITQKVQTYIAEGEAGETIVKNVIPSVDPDLLVIGSSSKTGMAKYFGSQASYMAKHAPISVLVVR